MSDRRENQNLDDFWDLASLLPQSAKAQRDTALTPPTPRYAPAHDTSAVEIEVQPQRSGALSEIYFAEHPVSPYNAPLQKPTEPELSYRPQNTLLHEVRIYAWRTQYDYYEQVRQHAIRFCTQEGTPAPQVDFFSYMPQYTQLNAAQLAYYLWWRTSFHRGTCLPCAYSYLLLYLYELINLGDHIDPAEGQARMLRLWLAYREEHPRLDPLIREWLCDYSLLYRLPAPVLPQKLYRVLLSGCRIKEFYLSLEGDDNALVSAVLLFCNNYDYTKSKFYTPENAAEYHRVLRGAVELALDYLRERFGERLMGEQGISTVSRDTFTGAICSYRLRRRIEVDYTSFSHTHELRYVISDVLKYAENALRAAKGIKSRLSIYAVDVPLRERLDAYLATAAPKRVRTAAPKKEEPVPEYEKRYELPRVAPSRKRATEIEAASWQTTKRLVEAFENLQENDNIPQNGTSFAKKQPNDGSLPPRAPEVTENLPFSASVEPENEAQGTLLGALGALCAFVQHCARGDVAAQRAFAAAYGKMPDAIVDEINTVAGELLGDILLEEAPTGGFSVIEDYRELLISEGVL